jgi:mono/diheme cytochrome c family protein
MSRRTVYALIAVAAAVLALGAAALRPTADGAPDALEGATLFRLKGCATCHDGPDSASPMDAGPSLAAAPSWAGDRVDGLSAEQYVEQSLRNPSAFVSPDHVAIGGPGGSMPLLQLSDEEIDALVGYLLER